MNSRLSKQQKTILIALQNSEQVQPWLVLHRLVVIATGVDPWKYGRKKQEPYDRQQSNKAYATVLRSLSRLEERGLVQWKFTDRNKRYPVFSDYGHSFWLDPKEFDHISGKVKLIDEMLNQATKENEQKLKEIFSEIADTFVEKIE
jgi:hypothetical protein